jgi:hypothetical protein
MRNGVVAALLVVAILAGAGAGYLVGNENERTINSTFAAVTTTTMTMTVSVTGNSSGLLAQCSHAEAPFLSGLLLGAVTAGTNTPAVICVQYYYFSSVPTTLATSMTIQATQPNRSFSGGSNFTVSTSANHLVFGGPQNEDEGAVVAFAVSTKPGASGTYELVFSGDYMLAPMEPAQCYYYDTLVAGDGSPLYVYPTGCITYAVTGTSTASLLSIPGIQYPILTNILYFRIVGVINSTG